MAENNDIDATAYIVDKIKNANPGHRVPDLATLCGLTEAAFTIIRKQIPEIDKAVEKYKSKNGAPVYRPPTPEDRAERKALKKHRDTVHVIKFTKGDSLVDKLETIEGLVNRVHIQSVVACKSLAETAGEALDELAKLRARQVYLTRELYRAKHALAQKIARPSGQVGGLGPSDKGILDDY